MRAVHIAGGLSCSEHAAACELFAGKSKDSSMHHNAIKISLLAQFWMHSHPPCLLTQAGLQLAVQHTSMPAPTSAITPCRKQQRRLMSMHVA